MSGKAGTHFFVKYRLKDERAWLNINHELNSVFTTVRGLQPDKTYQFAVVSVDGKYSTESLIQEVRTLSNEPKKSENLGAKKSAIGVYLGKIGSAEDLLVKYRLKGDENWSNINANAIGNNKFVELQPNKVYEFVVTSGDDNQSGTNVEESTQEEYD